MGSKRGTQGILSHRIANIFSRSHLGFLISMSGGGETGHAPTLAGDPGPTLWRRRRRNRSRSIILQETGARAGATMNQNPAGTGPRS